MKKFIYMLLALIFTFSIVGCSCLNKEVKEEPVQQQVTPVKPTPPTSPISPAPLKKDRN